MHPTRSMPGMPNPWVTTHPRLNAGKAAHSRSFFSLFQSLIGTARTWPRQIGANGAAESSASSCKSTTLLLIIILILRSRWNECQTSTAVGPWPGWSHFQSPSAQRSTRSKRWPACCSGPAGSPPPDPDWRPKPTAAAARTPDRHQQAGRRLSPSPARRWRYGGVDARRDRQGAVRFAQIRRFRDSALPHGMPHTRMPLSTGTAHRISAEPTRRACRPHSGTRQALPWHRTGVRQCRPPSR